MRHALKYGFLLTLCTLLLSLFAGKGLAASPSVYIDASDSQQDYGREVARLNQAAAQSGERKRGQQLFAVLCRSEGEAPDFDQLSPLYAVAGPNGCFTLYFGSEEEAERAVKELSALPGLRYAERDGEVTACGGQSYSFTSWAAEALSFGDYLDYSSRWGSGAVTVAIVDSGISPHPMLTGRMPESGYDYIDSDEDATNDPYGHGTNVAGIVADCTAGEPVYLYPIRILNGSGNGSISNLTNAIREAAQKGVDIINLSLQSQRVSAALDDAVLEAVSAGITVVIAAGNRGIDTAAISPAHLPTVGVLVVGSLETDGTRSYYSNYGESVDVYTYGTGIVCCSHDGGYTTNTGTSMAAPHISALAALLRLLHGELSPAEIEQRILSATDAALPLSAPDLRRIIPARLGFSLSALRLAQGDSLRLPTAALPETALEAITYTSSDETVLLIEDGVLCPVGDGSADVTVSCTGFAPFSFTVQVDSADCVTLRVPEGLLCLEDEALLGGAAFTHIVLPDGLERLGAHVLDECTALRSVSLPATLREIGENSFSGAVLLFEEGSLADTFAQANALPYVLSPLSGE